MNFTHDPSKRYIFTNDWFDRNINISMKYALTHVSQLDHPPIILEIGSHEGKSACWMLDNLCTHPDAKFIAIDPYFTTDKTSPVTENTYEYFKNNISCNYNAHKLTHYMDISFNILEQLKDRRDFDIIYIDGSHLEEDVCNDLEGSDVILRSGGIIILDDVGFEYNGGIANAITKFLSKHDNYSIVLKEYQVIIQKH